jgi:hypothetical protein
MLLLQQLPPCWCPLQAEVLVRGYQQVNTSVKQKIFWDKNARVNTSACKGASPELLLLLLLL